MKKILLACLLVTGASFAHAKTDVCIVSQGNNFWAATCTKQSDNLSEDTSKENSENNPYIYYGTFGYANIIKALMDKGYRHASGLDVSKSERVFLKMK